jgi:transposase InsO family protein
MASSNKPASFAAANHFPYCLARLATRSRKIVSAGLCGEDGLRYQLLRRRASAILTAEQFHAKTAVMLIHSFSTTPKWREDFEAFCRSMGAEALSANVRGAGFEGPALFFAWCAGEGALP